MLRCRVQWNVRAGVQTALATCEDNLATWSGILAEVM